MWPRRDRAQHRSCSSPISSSPPSYGDIYRCLRAAGSRCAASDGRCGIAELRDDYADLVIIDAFVGARVPADLTTAEFLADARRALSDHGVIMINITDRGPLGYARRVVAGVCLAFPHVLLCAEPSTLKGRRFGNVIIVGGSTPLPYAAIAQRAGQSPFPYRVLRGARLRQLLGRVSTVQRRGC